MLQCLGPGQLGEMELQFTEKKKTESGAGSGRETDKFSSSQVPLRPAASRALSPVGRGPCEAGVQEGRSWRRASHTHQHTGQT